MTESLKTNPTDPGMRVLVQLLRFHGIGADPSE
jgi:hypothetical protein